MITFRSGPGVVASGVLLAVLAATACSPEASKWEEAAAANTVVGYEGFLAEYPDGVLADSARERIGNLLYVRISGRVLHEDGSPIVGLWLILGEVVEEEEGTTYTALMGESGNPETETDSEGRFEFVAEQAAFTKSRAVWIDTGMLPGTMRNLGPLQSSGGQIRVFNLDELDGPVDIGDIIVTEGDLSPNI